MDSEYVKFDSYHQKDSRVNISATFKVEEKCTHKIGRTFFMTNAYVVVH
jgi:hypothetical protein